MKKNLAVLFLLLSLPHSPGECCLLMVFCFKFNFASSYTMFALFRFEPRRRKERKEKT